MMKTIGLFLGIVALLSLTGQTWAAKTVHCTGKDTCSLSETVDKNKDKTFEMKCESSSGEVFHPSYASCTPNDSVMTCDNKYDDGKNYEACRCYNEGNEHSKSLTIIILCK